MLIFLYGPDDFRSRQKLKEILAKYQKKFPQALNFVEFNLEEDLWEKARSFLVSSSLFFEKKFLILKCAFRLPKETQGKILTFLKEKAWHKDQKNLIIFFEPGPVDERLGLFKFLKKQATFQKFNYLEPAKIRQWLKKELSKRDPELGIAESAQTEFIKRINQNLWLLNSDLEKIIAYKKSRQEKTINKRDIEFLVGDWSEANVFHALDALALKNKRKALKDLNDQFLRLEPELKILSMFFYQFRSLLIVKSLKERGLGPTGIKKLTKLHPFVIYKLFSLVNNFSFQELKKVYERLFELEIGFKTGKITDKKMALKMFIVELCLK